MAEQDANSAEAPREADAQADTHGPAANGEVRLEGGTYEIIRSRLLAHSKELRERLDKLNAARKDVFGSIETKLVGNERVSTDNNCVPRDIAPVGDKVIFGYNVFIGLRATTAVGEVFAEYVWKDGAFTRTELDLLADPRFETDFKNLYKYYRHTTFAKFAVIGPHLFMVFRVGKGVGDVKTFKWLIHEDKLQYVDNRNDHEFAFPPQHEFEWTRVTLDMHRGGHSPHISIDDRVLVETIHGDLTIKIEDNTETGEGIYSEPVEDTDQALDDAEISYAIVGNIVILKIRPYQERDFRYIVYNEKVQEAVRIDSIADACVLLPDDHGLIFPKGYYLQTGQRKQFDNDMADMVFEKRLASPNGEDTLHVFYNRESGTYVLLSYNLIEQVIATPVVCHGYLYFDDGTLAYFRSDDRPQKHHAIQIWQTPYCGADYTAPIQSDSHLYRIGNKDIVRCMAECYEILTLIGKEESYANLYVDIARKAASVRDGYFWLDSPEAFNLAEPLTAIGTAAGAAVDEFEKVVRTRRNTEQEITRVSTRVRELIRRIDYDALQEINDFVRLLADLRAVRGEVISLRDLRYADGQLVESLEEDVAANTDDLSAHCVEFLLREDSLVPYTQRVEAQAGRIDGLKKVAEARELQEDVAAVAGELEMLTEIVSNLKIEDATQTTAIIDNISLVYSRLNQVKSALKNRMQDLASVEGRAEFNSQTKLLDQAVINYLDVCDTPEKCDDYLTKTMVQLETLESRFADFDEFIGRLTEKREELYNAFESRKVQLVEARNRRAMALYAAAERVLKGANNRVRGFTTINDINGYFASDLMVERIRENIEQLRDLGDSVKADDLASQLKSIQQDAVRQLKDKQALYEEGDDVIRLGTHRFSVNHQPLELTTVRRDGQMLLHLTGTGFFEPVDDESLGDMREVWDLDVLSESPGVYRAEYLAYLMLDAVGPEIDAVAAGKEPPGVDELVPRVQEFMGSRYAEGYVKGVHDTDAARILRELIDLRATVALMRFPTRARALAVVFWHLWGDVDRRNLLTARCAGVGQMQQLFAGKDATAAYVNELADCISEFAAETGLFEEDLVEDAAAYLYCELAGDAMFPVSKAAAKLRKDFEAHLRHNKFAKRFVKSCKAVSSPAEARYHLCRDWITAFAAEHAPDDAREYADEAAASMLDTDGRPVADVDVSRVLTGMVGSHPRIAGGKCHINYCHFMTRLRNHARNVVPLFEKYQDAKKAIITRHMEELHLEDFQPRVLTTFVRNQLIDKVYLPLVGDNLAKQIGTIGVDKRTDRQGLLMMISPPGYGKTTLMEYIANRLGLIFMKINGPALGHRVTSLDPAEATNAAAREELQKLNLAFEMGDNVMIYLDDIQHCNPELLQKFISLCDAQRRIEGVYKGKSRSYDLRGKRVCVVMAGNPYTESGEKFRIPDMLSNRADTYNIGDIVGDNRDVFVMSYVENSLTSNPVLGKLATRSQADVYALMKLAETGRRDDVEFEGNYSSDELNEYVSTMQKLFVVREVILKANQMYIRSAGQADEYRTEPPFLLQGSYRNMNRIASRALPVMNDDELWTLILSSYEQDAQTLTSGTESNLLKFKELVGRLGDDEAKRWNDIKKKFSQHQLLGGQDDDKVSLIIRQLNAFAGELGGIKDVLTQGVGVIGSQGGTPDESPDGPAAAALIAEHLAEKFGQSLESIRTVLAEGLAPSAERQGARAVEAVQDAAKHVMDRMDALILATRTQQAQAHAAATDRDARTLVAVLEEQFKTMETWLTPVTKSAEGRYNYADMLIGRFETMVEGYSHLIEVLKHSPSAGHKPEAPAPAKGETPTTQATAPPPMPPELPKPSAQAAQKAPKTKPKAKATRKRKSTGKRKLSGEA